MSELKQISPENKDRLVGLVSKVANYVTEGLEPTAALTKAAAEGDYPIDYVLRAAEAYNGAAHISYFKSATLNERGNSFPLADGYAAVNNIMAKVSGAHQVVAQDNFAYLKETNSYFEQPKLDESFLYETKQAAAPTVSFMLKAASSLGNQERLNIESAKTRYNSGCETLAKNVKDFRDKTAAVSDRRRTLWAKELLERHGKSALDVISLATNVTGADCAKLADERIGYFSLGTSEINNLDSIIQDFQRVSGLNGKLATAEHDHYVSKVERDSLLDSLTGRTKRSFGLDLFSSGMAGLKGINEAQNDVLGGPAVTDSKDIQSKAIESLADPAFFAESKNIDKALLMHKLLKEDPIISKHPALEVNQALQEIYAIAPTAAEYEPLMRSMLRKRLETGEQIDDFSLNQMISIDEKMRENTKELRIAPKLVGAETENRSVYG